MSARVTALSTTPLLTLLFRFFLGFIFVYAGCVKITEPHGFAQALYNYHILPGWLINPVAIILPWAEVVAGGSLLLGIWTLGGGVVATALLAIFALALGINLVRGVNISCGCFSTASTASPITWFHLAGNLILSGMGLSIVLFDQGRVSLDRLFRKKFR
jgi:uncharacterized membrane protein YphA (DoxX/SURF4 family)